jgi:hypothetical protein
MGMLVRHHQKLSSDPVSPGSLAALLLAIGMLIDSRNAL